MNPIKYKNYQVRTLDERNLVVSKLTTVTAVKDTKEHKTGDVYQVYVDKGFFGTVLGAFEWIYEDSIKDSSANSLTELIGAIKDLRAELKELLAPNLTTNQ